MPRDPIPRTPPPLWAAAEAADSLAHLGYAGSFDQQLDAFQRGAGVPITGVPDAHTLRALDALTSLEWRGDSAQWRDANGAWLPALKQAVVVRAIELELLPPGAAANLGDPDALFHQAMTRLQAATFRHLDEDALVLAFLDHDLLVLAFHDEDTDTGLWHEDSAVSLGLADDTGRLLERLRELDYALYDIEAPLDDAIISPMQAFAAHGPEGVGEIDDPLSREPVSEDPTYIDPVLEVMAERWSDLGEHWETFQQNLAERRGRRKALSWARRLFEDARGKVHAFREKLRDTLATGPGLLLRARKLFRIAWDALVRGADALRQGLEHAADLIRGRGWVRLGPGALNTIRQVDGDLRVIADTSVPLDAESARTALALQTRRMKLTLDLFCLAAEVPKAILTAGAAPPALVGKLVKITPEAIRVAKEIRSLIENTRAP